MNTNNKTKILSLDNNLLKISAEAYYLESKGEIILDIKNDELKWILKGKMSESFIKYYKNTDEIPTIKKSDIKAIYKSSKEEKERIALKIVLKNNISYIFSFYGDNKIKGYKIQELLDSDYFDYYKTEFKLLPTEYQKRICLLLDNKYLNILYKKIYNCNQDIDFIWEIIKYLYPQKIIINLGKNRIQLSRDEELLMFAQKKYNITKLIKSDDNISKSYLTKNNIKYDKFWDDFINNQRGNNSSFLVGGYKPSIYNLDNNNIEEEKKKTINIIFEDLEKDKYYYDNYVYIDKEMKNHQEKLKDKIKLLNDYSIDKMKNVNYFSYSSLLINYKKNMKNENIKRVIESDIFHINEEKNEDIINIEENVQYNNNNKIRLSKNELLNKISNMKKEFKNGKRGISAFNTMKEINKENFKIYNLVKDIDETSNNKYVNFVINNVFLIKDLLYALKSEKLGLIKSKNNNESSPQKQNINKRFENYSLEIRNNLEFLKKKRNQINNSENLPKVVDFLIENAEKAVMKEDINKYFKLSN